MSAPSDAECPSAPRRRLAVGALVLAYAALAGWLSWTLNVWLDEAYTLDSTGRGPAWALERALGFEMQPPLYFVALSLWRALGDSLFVARLPSVLMAAAALAVVARAWVRFTRNDAEPVSPAWVVAAFAVHPLVLYAGTEARVYGGVLLASAVMVATYAGAFLERPGRRASRVLFGLAGLAALYTHYYSGFLLAAGIVPLLARRDARALRAYLLCMAAIGLGFAPLATVLPGQFSGHVHTERESLGLLDLGRFAYVRGAAFVLPAVREQEELLVRRLRDVVVLGVGAVIALAVARDRARRLAPSARALVLWAGATLVLFTGVVALVGSRDQVASRHMMVALPPTLLAVFALVHATGGRRATVAACTVVTLFGAYASFRTYESGAKRGDWKRVAAYLETHETPGEPIVVFHAPSALALAHHYAGVNPIVPIPRPPSEERWYLPDYRLESADQIARAVERAAPGGYRSLWLVTDGIAGFMGVDFNADALEDFVRRDHTVVEERPFHKSYVQHLRRLGDGPKGDASVAPTPGATAPVGATLASP